MTNILFLNSYSEQATTHYRNALHLAQRLEATLHIAHIYDFRNHLNEELGQGFKPGEFDKWLLEIQRKESLILEDFIGSHTGKQHYQLIGETYVFEGTANEEVPKLLESFSYDLLVMGMRERWYMSDLMESGLTQLLVDTAKCPLLLLPQGSEPLTVKRICLATDLAEESLAAINYVFDFSLLLKADFYLLTVVGSDSEIGPANDRIEELQRQLHGGYTSKLYYSIEIGDPEDTIKKHQEEEDIDLLVLTTRQRKRWIDQFTPTITKSLVRQAEIPLLILKEEHVNDYQIL